MSSFIDVSAPGIVVAQRVFTAFSREDLRRYAEASGDLNPLHLDPDFAREAGFDDVIVHGMLGMALLGRLLAEGLPGRRVLRLRARFKKVIPVDRPIHCSATLGIRRDGCTELALTARDESGVAYIEGSATVAGPGTA